MTPANRAKNWKDCPYPSHNCMNYDTDREWKRRGGQKPCPTCLAHFDAVDKARAEAIGECAKVAMDWANERGATDAVQGRIAKAIRSLLTPSTAQLTADTTPQPEVK